MSGRTVSVKAPRRKRRLKGSHAVVHILLALLCLFMAFPLWYMLNNVFKAKDAIISHPYYITPSDFTFDNVVRAFELIKFPELFKNSMIYLVGSCAIMIVLGTLAGYAIGTMRNRFTRGAYMAIVMCITVPFQLYMIPTVMVLQRVGLYGTYAATCVTFAVTALPFVVFIYTGFMRTIPHEIYEAATVDGASSFGILMRIYMPLLKTVTGSVLILRGLTVWNSTLIPLVTVSKPTRRALVHGVYIFFSLNVSDWGMIFGASFLVSLPITILFLLMQKTFVKGLTAGSVKG